MKKKKIVLIAFALVLVVYFVYKVYERWPTQNWKEYRSLVRIWPRLKKEGIESIRFCSARSPQYGDDKDSDFQEIVETFSFRVREVNVVESWKSGIRVPEERMPECIKIIDKAMKGVRPSWGLGGYRIWPLSKMLIVTNKGKYIVHVETDISETAGPKVYGEEWVSYDLGKFLAKYCFPGREFKYRYEIPTKEQTVAILLYSLKFSPPLVFFGDKKLAEELLFNPPVKDPNGIKGIAGLYKAGQLRMFGFDFKKEAGELIPSSNELKPKKTFGGREWLEKIMDAYEVALKEAEERGKYFPSRTENPVGRIVFMTREENYWKEIGIDENTVFDDYIKSEPLKAYFDDLGLTKELMAKKPNNDE